MVTYDDRAAERVRSRLERGDLRVLLMGLVHMTGDLGWLDAPFLPKRDQRLIPAPDAGLPEEARVRILDAMTKVLVKGVAPVLTDPGDALIQRMMSVCLGEVVPPEYAPLTREEMALTPRHAAWSRSAPDVSDRHVLIVGAGVCGIALAVSLKSLGVPFTIVEKSDDIGGTWHANRYPGCGVDTPNHAYSYSFGPRYQWPRFFSQREDVKRYLSTVVEQFGLREHIRFHTLLEDTRWDEGQGCWTSRLTADGRSEQFRSGFVVSAIGQLSDPQVPRIEGADNFEGRIFHSSVWPDDLSVEGRRLAVIGTGATAMQLVPTVADSVASVAVFQRSPQWSRPIPGYSDLIDDDVQWLLQHVPFYAEWFRFNMFWRYGDGLLPLLKKDPAWGFPDRAVNRINDRHRQEMTDFILTELEDRPDLIEKCVPTYPPYGKRILLDNNWFGTLKKPNVELVDTPISHIDAHGIVTKDGTRRDADIIVYSTGFKVTELAARLNIVGRNGRSLAEAWADENPAAYLGLSVPGFPNFFTMLGPTSGPAHGGSAVFQAECQARYISACIVQMAEAGIRSIDVRENVHHEYIGKVDAEHETLIWTHPGMSTYYRNRHGRVFSVMPWRFVDYWSMTHDPDLDLYELDYATETLAQSR